MVLSFRKGAAHKHLWNDISNINCYKTTYKIIWILLVERIIWSVGNNEGWTPEWMLQNQAPIILVYKKSIDFYEMCQNWIRGIWLHPEGKPRHNEMMQKGSTGSPRDHSFIFRTVLKAQSEIQQMKTSMNILDLSTASKQHQWTQSVSKHQWNPTNQNINELPGNINEHQYQTI